MNKPQTDKMDQAHHASPAGLPTSTEFDAALDRDFGSAMDSHQDGVSRRRWLQLMGASLALGGAVGCRYEEETIAPFAFRPQNRVPGVPEKFASMIELGGVAEPIVSTNYDGRPIKLDGNPEHPCSRGGSTAFTQARMLEFYDPDRLRHSLKATGQKDKSGNLFDEVEFDSIVDVFQPLLSKDDLSSVAVLAQPTSSPTLMRMQESFVQKGGSWVTFAPISDDNTRAGMKTAFEKALRAQYRFSKAKVIVTLDADPLGLSEGSVPNSIEFAKSRDADSKDMSRLYAIESQYSTTGAAADHRISVASSAIPGFVAALTDAIESTDPDAKIDKKLPYRERVLAAVAQDLKANQGASIIIAGEKQSPEIHAAVHALNQKLGNHGKTIEFIELSDPGRSNMQAIQDLANQLGGGSIETLVVLGGNPVHDAPRELKLGDRIASVKNSLHVTTSKNETSVVCQWISHQAHPLETWQDGYAFDGSVLVGQPLINPLFGGKSVIETLATLTGSDTTDGQAIVRETLKDFGLDDTAWRKAVHDGFVDEAESQTVDVFAKESPNLESSDAWKAWDGESLEVVFNPSSSVYDGRFANSAWLQELPNFFTKVSWDNVASVSPRTAEKLGLKQEMMVTLKINGVEQKMPVYIQPGQADGSIGLEIGYGRMVAGRVGGYVTQGVDTVGHDVYGLRSIEQWHVAGGLDKGAVIPSRTNYQLATVQEPWVLDEVGRNEIQARMFRDYNKTETKRSGLLREGSFESYREFLDRHPLSQDTDSHDDDHANEKDHARLSPDPSRRSGIRHAVAKSGALPIINPIVFDDKDHGLGSHDPITSQHAPLKDDAAEEHHHGEHGEHGHQPQWPEAFHMHHELFDITPGAREDYKQENPHYKNIWGMSIDLNKCVGCNSCVVACQSENNIPVVGKADVWRGRELHWLRIDRYFGDNLYTEDARDDDKIVVQQPVTCHHCENAPCETVCPVAATTHSREGLNDMVYNRCIGTRYCGNNCPYKVRRFNYFNYSDAVTLLKYPGDEKIKTGDRNLQNLMMNPEVTVRSRGVMEKCTFCVQRIQNTKIQAKNEHREIGPNEIQVACQQACPSEAIKFGDLNNPASDVAKAHANPRAYTMLEELNIRPRTRYLAKVRNVHPALIDFDDRDSVPKHGGGHGHDDHGHEDNNEHDHGHDDQAEHDHNA